jgi:hypothetical protein
VVALGATALILAVPVAWLLNLLLNQLPMVELFELLMTGAP